MSIAQRTVAGVVVSCSLVGVAAKGAVVYDSISRSVTARTTTVPMLGIGNSTQGPWQAAVFARDPSLDNPNANPATVVTLSGGGGWGVQDSTLGPTSMQAHLLAKAWDGLSGFEGGATSTLSATFTLTESTPVDLSGLWATNYNGVAGPSFSGRVLLTGPGGTIFDRGYAIPVTSGPLAFSGVLAGGQYTLTAEARYEFVGLSPLNASQMMSVDFVLTLPAPATTGLAGIVVLVSQHRRRTRASWRAR